MIVAPIEPRENQELLYRAWRRWQEQEGGHVPDLVLANPSGWGNAVPLARKVGDDPVAAHGGVDVVELVRFVGGAIRGQRLRSFLSALGVAIGVTAVILLTSLGEGQPLPIRDVVVVLTAGGKQ